MKGNSSSAAASAVSSASTKPADPKAEAQPVVAPQATASTADDSPIVFLGTAFKCPSGILNQ